MDNVSRETSARLETYHALLVKWQKAINLVGNKTIAQARERHFNDSAQLVAYIPDTVKTLVDLGSGAGFPGMVLAMLRPDMDVHLIESDERKAEFLRTVSRETNTQAHIHVHRIEDIAGDIMPDIVTARALAPLTELLGYCRGWAVQNNDPVMLFHKGQGADSEIEDAREKYEFDVKTHPSKTSEEGCILEIRNLRTSG